ncbi:MAG: hypothetical protein RL141_15 [Candidatus Parcubacteria bacterium]|jgi:hypothetical protein
MFHFRPERLMLLVLFITLGIFLSFGTILPNETTAVFASPDETAVAQFARGWTLKEGFRLPAGIPEAVADIAGLHPRSMVQQGAWVVPVGFLGMPMLLMPFEKMREGSGAFLMVLLVASSVWPLWRFARGISRRAALAASVVYLTFPTVLLYANRGLFPNLPVVALGLWSVWLVGEKARWKVIVGGILFGAALAIRPLEGLWLMPWVVWGFLRGRNLKNVWRTSMTGWVVAASLLFPAFAYVASIQTYQSIVPTIGYWLRDTAVRSEETPAANQAADIRTITETADLLPFGVHPRTMESNIRLFLLEMLWPWVLLALAGLWQCWWSGRVTFRSPTLWLSGWTIAVLLLFYGQATYLDNIRGTPAIGNSFLRYLLPLTPFIALAIGAWLDAVARNTYRTIAGSAVIVVLAFYGGWMGLARDEESVLATRAELHRYVEIRAQAARTLAPGTILISERSDKIFTGLPGLVAVSPLPSEEIFRALLGTDVPIVWFHRLFTQEELAARGIEGEEIFRHDNEGLYRITLE